MWGYVWSMLEEMGDCEKKFFLCSEEKYGRRSEIVLSTRGLFINTRVNHTKEFNAQLHENPTINGKLLWIDEFFIGIRRGNSIGMKHMGKLQLSKIVCYWLWTLFRIRTEPKVVPTIETFLGSVAHLFVFSMLLFLIVFY